MDKFVIHGGPRLRGEVTVSGSKNATLPILAATLLTEGKSTIVGVPDLADVTNMRELLGDLGAEAIGLPGRIEVTVRDETRSHAVYDRVRKMRASICVLGPLLAKRERARVSMPGGCAIGLRPVNLHLRGLRAGSRDRTGRRRHRRHGQAPARCVGVPGRAVRLDRAGHGQHHDGRDAGRGRAP